MHVMFDGDETEYWCAVQGLHKASAPCQHLARLVARVSQWSADTQVPNRFGEDVAGG